MHDNIRRRALNDINEVGNINFQTGNKIKKTKTFLCRSFFAEVSLLRQILERVLESRKYSEEIRRDKVH